MACLYLGPPALKTFRTDKVLSAQYDEEAECLVVVLENSVHISPLRSSESSGALSGSSNCQRTFCIDVGTQDAIIRTKPSRKLDVVAVQLSSKKLALYFSPFRCSTAQEGDEGKRAVSAPLIAEVCVKQNDARRAGTCTPQSIVSESCLSPKEGTGCALWRFGFTTHQPFLVAAIIPR
eukprot:NODE_3563_length_953_cov_23.346239_g3273_i0.p1 GENE.NODE_3563_length_953_cov_23.346239_g3273_i0~~NODE_3563_length_953_cov_23.346239_g3273_i0.p1  ORF type:complete len:178 (+),score=25.25 NODE_3563_length_953_cov_23.346239_g3273_i0:177-710(+)